MVATRISVIRSFFVFCRMGRLFANGAGARARARAWRARGHAGYVITLAWQWGTQEGSVVAQSWPPRLWGAQNELHTRAVSALALLVTTILP
jgi:hypothetical protein